MISDRNTNRKPEEEEEEEEVEGEGKGRGRGRGRRKRKKKKIFFSIESLTLGKITLGKINPWTNQKKRLSVFGRIVSRQFNRVSRL